MTLTIVSNYRHDLYPPSKIQILLAMSFYSIHLLELWPFTLILSMTSIQINVIKGQKSYKFIMTFIICSMSIGSLTLGFHAEIHSETLVLMLKIRIRECLHQFMLVTDIALRWTIGCLMLESYKQMLAKQVYVMRWIYWTCSTLIDLCLD